MWRLTILVVFLSDAVVGLDFGALVNDSNVIVNILDPQSAKALDLRKFLTIFLN